MPELNVLQGRKFEDCYQEYTTPQVPIDSLHELILERLGELNLGPANPQDILSAGYFCEGFHENERLDLIEGCDVLVRKIFRQSLFESTQLSIEFEVRLRDAENEYEKAQRAAEGARVKLWELRGIYQEQVEEVGG